VFASAARGFTAAVPELPNIHAPKPAAKKNVIEGDRREDKVIISIVQ